ncbi:MAG: group III truncated hemoglobin [Bdellovibrionaceae bacterium]|nr:group III truncated hemoglobin [Pseudobdellovibrionaceae bacterium]
MQNENRPDPKDTVYVNGVSFSNHDLYIVVEDFYTRIQQDPILHVPFLSVVDWPEHIQKITHFWWIRFGGPAYMFSEYNPVAKHFFAGFNPELLQRWLSLFHATLETHLSQKQASLWKNISTRMGDALTIKNELFKQTYETDSKK